MTKRKTQKHKEEKTPVSKDRWIKCIARGGNMIATAISAESVVTEARERHGLGAIETKALGQALLAGLLLGSTCKAGEKVSLSVKGDGFLRQAIADATPDGAVRGFITTRESAGELDSDKGPWQSGMLSITRLKINEKEPYVGTVPTITGHLPKDLTFYLSQSEQVPAAVGIAVNSDEGGKVTSAGAFLVQVLPGAEPREIAMVEKNIHHLQSLAAQIAHDSDPTKLLGQIFDDMSFVIIEERPLKFECNCSRDRVIRALRLLGEAELSDMIAKDKGAHITCDFCGEKYAFTEAELGGVIG